MKAIALLFVVAMGLLAGCAAPVPGPAPVTLQSPGVRMQIDAVATLAVGECDVQTAPDYTGVTVDMRQAARKLRAKELPVDAARQIDALGGEVIALLGKACQRGKFDPGPMADVRTKRAEIKRLMEAPRAN